jgi:hypothetical protein
VNDPTCIVTAAITVFTPKILSRVEMAGYGSTPRVRAMGLALDERRTAIREFRSKRVELIGGKQNPEVPRFSHANLVPLDERDAIFEDY